MPISHSHSCCKIGTGANYSVVGMLRVKTDAAMKVCTDANGC